MTRERKRAWIRLALVSFFLDLASSAIEIPFLELLPFSLPIKEALEWWLSTSIARNQIQLDRIDRLLGLLPIPGVTAVTVRVFREIIGIKRESSAETKEEPELK